MWALKTVSAVSLTKEMDTYPVVVKADGLALGKGVIIAHDLKAQNIIVSMMENKFNIRYKDSY